MADCALSVDCLQVAAHELADVLPEVSRSDGGYECASVHFFGVGLLGSPGWDCITPPAPRLAKRLCIHGNKFQRNEAARPPGRARDAEQHYRAQCYDIRRGQLDNQRLLLSRSTQTGIACR